MPLRRVSALLAAFLVAGCTGSVVTGYGNASHTQGAQNTPGTRGTAPGTPPVPTEPPANFVNCVPSSTVGALGLPPGRKHKLSFGCATISVPVDYSDPSGPTMRILLVRVHDSDNHQPVGSLIVNPGGPGVSGTKLALDLAGQVSDRLLQHFDLVGFDPRGVGYSSPVRCLSDAEKDRFDAASPDILTAAGFAQAKQLARQFAEKCTAKYGARLADYNTVNTARDMDLVRQAVGDPMMNYLGFSYGTELGAQYAHLFPSKVRVAVLDGAVDPLIGPIQSSANQVKGFEDSFDQFATWCRGDSTCAALGDPRQAVYAIAAKARKSPIPSSAPGETRKATSAIVYTGVLLALYSRSLWPSLGQALLDARSGDSKGLFTLADDYNERSRGHYTNFIDAITTINCNDSSPGPSDATIHATARSWAKRFPMFGLWSAASLFSCQSWQPHRTVPPRPTAPNTPDKVLVIGNLHDPATPYHGAQDLSRTLGNAELLTWNGEGHTSYLQGSSCVDHYVDDYLINETLPPVGKTCPR